MTAPVMDPVETHSHTPLLLHRYCPRCCKLPLDGSAPIGTPVVTLCGERSSIIRTPGRQPCVVCLDLRDRCPKCGKP